MIAADRNVALLGGCLESIVRNAGDVPFEVVIVLNGSPEDVRSFVAADVNGAKVVESHVNRGVAGGYNLGRAVADGEFIVLLHDDVEVSPGWLEALVGAADETADAGAIGAYALNADGSLQAAGAKIHREGTTEVVKAEFSERRAVDYSGSYCLLVRATTWDAIGGLDERFFPAYYVDVDLAMSIRAHGQAVFCEPGARVTHHRWGATTNEALRIFAARRNRQRFLEKWQSGSLSERRPVSLDDYRRLDAELRRAYRRSWPFRLRQLVSRLAASSRRG